MVMASFTADSLALGAHWIYDTALIKQQFGRVENLIKPLKESFHPNKDLGEFTHYGDQALRLLESLATGSGFDLDHFATNWQELFDGYQGYFDKATKTTLDHFAGGKRPQESGSGSTDLGGAARISPLAYSYQQDLERLIASARAQTAMTHNHPHVVDSAEFFARVVWKVLRETPPVSALKQVVEESFNNTLFDKWVTAGVNSAGQGSREAIAGFGQMCDAQAAFPAVVHLIAKYEGNLKEALIENVMAGGDSAARGMIVGMISGAHLGLEAIPNKWLSDLKAHDLIVQLLGKIARLTL
jgi:ADP-ribosylglycohydrolase